MTETHTVPNSISDPARFPIYGTATGKGESIVISAGGLSASGVDAVETLCTELVVAGFAARRPLLIYRDGKHVETVASLADGARRAHGNQNAAKNSGATNSGSTVSERDSRSKPAPKWQTPFRVQGARSRKRKVAA